MLETIMYIALGVMAISYFFGALYWGFSTPVRTATSIVVLILLFKFIFKGINNISDIGSIITFVVIASIILYNLKELGIFSIVILLFLGNNSKSTEIKKAEDLTNKKVNKNNVCEYYYIDTNVLNLRNHPNIQSKKIGIVTDGMKVCITKKEKSWAYIKDKGWVSNKYLKEE